MRKGKMVKKIDKIIDSIVPILARNNARRAALFGSVISDNFDEQSDVDILVELDDSLSLLDYIGIIIELEDKLGRKVDLVEYDTIKPALKDEIERSALRIL
ncbi:nucleotidyltransferase family protein [bacterium]|nr:nucleotidyltransferase family protein [bacterium]